MSRAVTVTFPSNITYLVPEELVQYFAQAGGEPEKQLIEWARKFLRYDGVFVDVGAHIGTYALSYAPEVKATYAFEAQRNTFARLAGGVALLGNDTIFLERAALSDVNTGEATLKVATSDGGLSSICELPHNQAPFRTESVPLRTLDSFGIDSVCLMKIDVEGNELRVLQGAVETLKRSGFPPLLVEVWNDDWYAEEREKVRAFLTELGYQITPAPDFSYMWVCEHASRAAPAAPVTETRPEDSEKRKRILLTMIVKNESGVIERGLRTVLPHVDGFSICDTGSTDGTPSIIARLGEEHGVRGTVHRTTWKNYGHNRTESATRAREWALERGWALEDTYLFFVDADMKLHISGDFFPEFSPESLTAHSYLVLQGNPGNFYPNTRLARADFEWKSLGVTHEFWAAEGAEINAHRCEALWLEDGNDGGNRSTKFERDRTLLEQGLRDEPTNERYMFYLAQTYFDLGEYARAAEWYEKRWQAGGYGEERMYARMKQGRALLALGDARGVDVLLRAFGEFPHRIDPLFYLAVHYREQGQNRLAEQYISIAIMVPRPDPYGLFIEQDMYDWRLDFERSIVSFYTENKRQGHLAADRVSRMRAPGIDHEHMGRTLMHYTEPLTLKARNVLVIPENILVDPVTGTKYESSSPTVTRLPDGAFLVGVRLVNYDHAKGNWFNSKDEDRIIRTREVTAVLPWLEGADRAYQPVEVKQNVPESWPKAPVLGLEDQRFITYRDRVWFTANSWQCPHRPGYPQMVLGRLNKACDEVEHVVPLRWEHMQAIEKNWLPFAHDGEIKLVYGYDPLVILGVDPESGECHEVARHEMRWHSSRFRGSAGPVRHPSNLNHLLLVHEVTANDDQRIYGQRLLELGRDFEPLRLSAPFYIDHRGVEFPLGFIALDGKRALITYGREERESVVAEVEWSELLSRLTP